MSDIAARIAALSPEKQALFARKLRAENAAKASEPLAIVGIGCRFPGGADDPESLWRLLSEGRDSVAEVPARRWDGNALYDPEQKRSGTMTSRWGSWLEHLEEFDAAFFAMAPREAARTDPQQRLLMEVAFEALEDAGLPLESLAGSRTGVYVGTHSNDYSFMVFGDARGLDAYASTGTSRSIAANRLSYTWDLRGPSIAVDTACSASLVAVHLACQALRQGECDLALAGGINLILSPLWSIALSRLPGMLSPTGRCRTFDAAADGIVRGEGCGLVALKRLPDALAAGDRIWAIIRGTATNQDGRTNGITAPNGLSQQAVLRAALADAGLAGEEISAIEAHGTGTNLGDPIEVEALGEVLGKGSAAENPCRLGSIKTNIGHLEAAAGVAGLIKLALSLHHERWPGIVHFQSVNPHITTAGTRFSFSAEEQPWQRGNVPRRGGVSAFGFGGANAHIVLEEAPAPAAPASGAVRQRVLPVSAQTDAALHARARELAAHLRGQPQASLDDIAFTTARRRSRFEVGAAAAGATQVELVERLEALAAGATPRGTVRTRRSAGRPGPLVFVFSGQGSQWPGMLATLAAQESEIAAALAECEAQIARHATWSLGEELHRDAATSRLGQTEFAQPAIFAVHIAIARWFAARGVVPGAVLGHSVGEIAAAHLAGMLDLAQAVEVVVKRARLMQAATGLGRMLAVEADDARLAGIVEDSNGALSWAAFNAPGSRVLAGATEAVKAAAARLEERGASCKWLPVDYAFHSTQMEGCAAALESELRLLAPQPPRLPFLSSVDAAVSPQGAAGAGYWRRNVREPVRFAQAVAAACALGARHFIEIGPHAVLGRALRQCLKHAEIGGSILGTLARDDRDAAPLYAALGGIALLGHEPRWDVAQPAGQVVSLPAYPWQRESYPLPRAKTSGPAEAGEAHGLLGARLQTAVPTFASRLARDQALWFADHVIDGRALLPAAGFLALASEAARSLLGADDFVIEDLVVGEPLAVMDGETRQLQVACVQESADVLALRFHSRKEEDRTSPSWTEHAGARVLRNRPAAAADMQPADGLVVADVAAHYAALCARGATFGPGYQTVARLETGAHDAVATVTVLAAAADAPGALPALLDGAVQAASVLMHTAADGRLYLPFSIARARLAVPLPRTLRVHARRRAGALACDIVGRDADERIVLQIEDLRFRPAQAPAAGTVALHEVVWREAPLAASGAAAMPPAAAAVFRAPPQGEPAAAANQLLAFLQDLVGRSPREERLAIVSRGARAVFDREVPDLSAAPLLGMAQVIALEHPELRVRCIDLDPASGDESGLAAELAADDGEEAVAFRHGARYVARLTRTDSAAAAPPRQLRKGDAAVIEAMTHVHLERRKPGPGEIEIEVLAAGINFRDVLNVLGLYPGDPVPLGNECAGRVSAVGAGVAHLAPGDLVMGVAIGSLASYVIVDARLQVHKPAALPLIQAAAAPIAFLTAHYALHHLAALRRGDHVLIHAAAGGVGLAAVAMARAAGAVIHGTAGSDRKRNFLRARGVQHVFDSRSLSFADGVRAATGGRGVDIVLNSLSGEFIDRSFDVLATGGRFLEIGKRGIRTREQVQAARPDAAYHVVYLGAVCEEEPELVQGHLAAVVDGLVSGALDPLPVEVWPADSAQDAFRYMKQARHIGKLVLTYDGTAQQPPLRPDRAYAVTGGLGGLGLVVARDLASRGARHIALLSRSAPGPAAQAALGELRNAGVNVVPVPVDVADAGALETALAAIERDLAPIAGIVHAAGILDDGPLAAQTAERFARVFAPKVTGAMNLHRWSLSRQLDFFSLFSSAASLVGWPGQSSYAAANACLDSLAHHRRALGLPAQSLNWGAWRDVGMAAALGEQDRGRMERQGMGAMTPDEGAAAFAAAMALDQPQVAPLKMDYAAFANTGGARRARPFLDEVKSAGAAAAPAAAPALSQQRGLAQQLAEAPRNRRRALVNARVRAQTLRTLGLPESFPLDERRGLRDLGLDSLMAVELRNALQQLAELPLPPTLLFDYPTVEALTSHLLTLLTTQAPAAPAAAPAAAAAAVGQETDAELEMALRAELAALRGESGR